MSDGYAGVFNLDEKAEINKNYREKYNPIEQDKVIRVFTQMLWAATKDGGAKRAAGLKQPWYIDETHEAALFSHLNKWKHGVKIDPDSGVHPLIHGAWRMLAIAYQETAGRTEPE